MNAEKIATLTAHSIVSGSYSEKDKEFEIQTLEWMEKNRPFESTRSHCLSSYEIVWVKEGSGTLAVDLQQYRISNQTLFCFAPGQHLFIQSLQRMHGYYIRLSSDFLHSVENRLNSPLFASSFIGGPNQTLIPVDREIQMELEFVVNKMLKEFRNYFHLRSEVLKGYLRIFLIYLSRNIKMPVGGHVHDKEIEMFRKFIDLLKKHYTTKKLVLDYANELCVTPNYLNSVVKQVSGYPTSHHIQQYIILEAKRMTLYSGLCMKEVANALGFEDYAHFSKYFKNYSGMSFTNFKMRIREHS